MEEDAGGVYKLLGTCGGEQWIVFINTVYRKMKMKIKFKNSM